MMAESASRSHHPRILVLDDDPLFRSLLVSLAHDFGLEVEAYESLQEVEPFLRMNSFDGAILDYHLLESDVIQHIGGIESFFKGIPTLLVSADDGAESALAPGQSSPFIAFVSKFRGGRVILETMGRLVRRGSVGQG